MAKKINKKSTTKNQKKAKEIKIKLKDSKFYSIILTLIDISIIIYSAKHNYVNYVSLPGKGKILIGTTKNIVFGRNYITLIVTCFICIYTFICNKYLFNIKNTKKRVLLTILFYLIINLVLFYLFTNKIY